MQPADAVAGPSLQATGIMLLSGFMTPQGGGAILCP
jgi:hypothetical protein